MEETVSTLDPFTFHDQVREALHHLYDYERLRSLQLGAWLRVEPGPGGRCTLNRLLIDTVDALKPTQSTPPDTPAWRVYAILFYRFIQCMTAQEVANQLGVGERHYRRYQAQAIHCLADLLWESRIISQSVGPLANHEPSAPKPEEATALPSELAWLQDKQQIYRADLEEILIGVAKVLAPLAATRRVRLEITVAPDLPRLRIHPQAMRQILVNILSYAIELTSDGSIVLNTYLAEKMAQLQIVSRAASMPPAQSDATTAETLIVSHQLLDMVDGHLQMTTATDGHRFTIHVPVAQRIPVMIVEDNVDTAQLFARYLADSRYRPVVASTGKEALTLVSEVRPRAILLDVMMPDQDGWDTLILLRTHPKTEKTPVIVTTILHDRELAFSLGATGFLHKPVSREQLLAALDQAVCRVSDSPAV